MPHQTQDVTDYHAGDARDLPVTVEHPDGTAKDISNGTAEWLLKDAASDTDANALLTKTTTDGGITITDAANGKLEVSIETGDTTGMSGTKHHRLRVTDSDGDRVTVFHGDFVISI